MITACFTGLVRAVGIFLSAIISAEFIYFLLFSETLEEAIENDVCNPYRFKNAPKLTAKAMGFIFFIHPCKYHSSLIRRTSLARKDVFADRPLQKLTTCL